MPATSIVLRQAFLTRDRPGQQSASERGIGDEADFELTGRPQCFFRLGPVQQRVFVLYGGDVVHGVRSANCLRTRLAQSESTDLALFDQPRHGAHGIFNRHGRIDAVLVIEVDRVDAQAA